MTGRAYSQPIQVDAARPARSTLALLGRYRGRVGAALVAFVVKDTPLWLMPVLTASIIDTVVRGGPVSRLFVLVAIAAVALAQNYPTHWLFIRLYSKAVRQIGMDLRNALTDQLQRLSIGYHSRSSSSVVQNKVVRDVENLENMFLQVGHPLVSSIIVLTGALVMTAVNIPAFLPVYALTVPIAVLLRRFLRRRSQSLNERFRHDTERFASAVGEMASLIPITRAHGLETVAQDRVATVADRLKTSGYTLDVMNGRFQALSWVAMQLLAIGCIALAAFCAITGFLPITAGQVVLVSSYFAMLTGNVTNLLMLAPLVAKGLESTRSVAEVLQEPDLEFNEGKREVGAVQGRLTLQDVTQRFLEDEPPALDHVDLEIPAGRAVAFVGPSGSGKSTMLNTLVGFIRPTDGVVLLDGVEMEELDLRTFRTRVSIVPQEPVLFEGSIRDNVAYGMGDVDEARLRRALDGANALDFVQELPQGLETIVGERGARLSGGQRQRLAIARALIRDPRVLLLDEATSALDPESERLVRDALQRLMRGRTTLIVAHRLSTVRAADEIVVLDHGRVAERGTHDELLAAGGRYARMHDLQTAG
ncbi:ABC transporter ATP-binding protein [Amnibacterium kyonggiense]|uniref:ABC transporter ATP-binding protein n=1 Tax=Amnibacterium kyonggiense TaxID=595671 RepID=UPI001FEB7FDE|nr:ABC transporter ATP-binding protein [Amnibacterium kyonggiense]